MSTQKAAGTSKPRLAAVNLSMNLGQISKLPNPGDNQDCNPGGSVICTTGTQGCGGAGLSCVGNSCSGASATIDWGFEAQILVNPVELQALNKELTAVVRKFAAGR